MHKFDRSETRHTGASWFQGRGLTSGAVHTHAARPPVRAAGPSTASPGVYKHPNTRYTHGLCWAIGL